MSSQNTGFAPDTSVKSSACQPNNRQVWAISAFRRIPVVTKIQKWMPFAAAIAATIQPFYAKMRLVIRGRFELTDSAVKEQRLDQLD